ncbi:MAG: hypothetical protein IKC49_01765 [Clostridia bacterium]|nr:hypothetical protein [Clostridia bacterium]
MFNISNEELIELSIYELRNLARETGVKSPTSKVKNELVRQIIEIREGRLDPVVERSKKGRPPKSINYSFRAKPKVIKLCQDESSFDYADDVLSSGYVDVSEGVARLRLEDHLRTEYAISDELLTKFSLKNGDKLLVELDFNIGQVKDVFNVNGLPIDQVQNRVDYYDIEHVSTVNEIKFVNKLGDLKADFGDNVFLFGNNNINNTKMLINALNNVENCKKIYVNTSITEKNKGLVNELKDCDKFLANITDDFDYVMSVVALVVDYAKRLFETGENVVVAIDDVLSISAIEDRNMICTKELLALAKSAKNPASISVFALMTRDEKLLWADKLADKRFVIDGEDFMMLR